MSITMEYDKLISEAGLVSLATSGFIRLIFSATNSLVSRELFFQIQSKLGKERTRILGFLAKHATTCV